MGVEYTIYCDRCGGIIDANRKSPAEARRVAVEQGVMVRFKPAGRKPLEDVCTARCAPRKDENA
jgi:hypothetical protein